MLGCNCAGCCAQPQTSCQSDADCTGEGESCDTTDGPTKNECVFKLPQICGDGTAFNTATMQCEIQCTNGGNGRMLGYAQLFGQPAPH